MAAKPDEYRRKAEEADASAKSTRDLSARAMYEQIAAHSRYLADQHERMGGWTTIGLGVARKPPEGTGT